MYKLIILFITWNLIISNFYQTSLKINLCRL
nr:MAG TPA: hypothetical protein [Caudoviricetes sp.]DAR67316.1 MAG TPA: hypothetical protein [Caudoviricetes sp.]